MAAWCNETARESWIILDMKTAGNVTAPNNIPDEAPGLKNWNYNNAHIHHRKSPNKINFKNRKRRVRVPGAELGEGGGRIGEDVEGEGGEGEERESDAVGEEREGEGEEDASNEQQHHGSLSVHHSGHRHRHARHWNWRT